MPLSVRALADNVPSLATSPKTTLTCGLRLSTDYAPTIFASLGLDPNTTSLLATGVYGVCNMVSTLPAVLLLDRLGRRKLLLAGSVGCFCSLVVVGAIVAACANDWAAHASAGRVAIGESPRG